MLDGPKQKPEKPLRTRNKSTENPEKSVRRPQTQCKMGGYGLQAPLRIAKEQVGEKSTDAGG